MSKKLPSFQFYPGDWLKDPAVRCVSLAARGLWIDMLCLMHESPRRGFLQHATGQPVTAEQLARMTGCSTDEVSRLLQELDDAGVFSCTEHGTIFSRRMVRDERKRVLCSEAGRRGGGNPALQNNQTFKGGAKGAAKGDLKGRNKGPPKASSSYSSSDPPPTTTSSSSSSDGARPSPRKTTTTATTREGMQDSVRRSALEICAVLWPGRREPITDTRDQRLIYQLAVLAQEGHQDWIRRLIAAARQSKARRPLAWVLAQAQLYAPEGVDAKRALAGVEVPSWALADPRAWPEHAWGNGGRPRDCAAEAVEN